MATLMVIEPEATGHRMVLYVRLIVAEALARGLKVVLLTSTEATRHDACKSVLSEFGDRLRVEIMPGIVRAGKSRFELFRAQYRWIRAFQVGYRAVSKQERIDFVYIPYFNYIDKIIGWYGSPFDETPFGGMVLAAKFHHLACGVVGTRGKQDIVNELFFRWALNVPKLAVLTSIDEPLANYVNESVKRHIGKVRYVPDVSAIRQLADSRTARTKFGMSRGEFVILLYGSVSPRKGLAKLLRLFEAQDLPPHFRLLIVGAQDADAKRMIAEFLFNYPHRRHQVTIVDRFVTDQEEGLAFASADVVWLCYENFSGMSGVLIQAAQAGVPVVTAGYGLIEHYREKHALGLRWGDFVTVEQSGVRVNWARLVASVAATRGSARLDAFAKLHTPQAFGRNVVDAIAASQNWRLAEVEMHVV